MHTQTVPTEALMLKHQTISTHITDQLSIVLAQFHTEILQLPGTILENTIKFWKKITQLFNMLKG